MNPNYDSIPKYNIHGNRFYNVGLDYGYRWHRFSFLGEAAIGKKGFVLLNKLQYSPVQGANLLLIHRYYTHDYWAMFAVRLAKVVMYRMKMAGILPVKYLLSVIGNSLHL